LADGPQLARAMALSGTVTTTARLTGTALGGAAVALLALQGVVLVAVDGYLAVLLLVWSVRVPAASPPKKAGRPQRSLVLARRTPGVLPLLLSVGLLAGSVLPVLSLLLPLAARERNWTAGQTALIEAAWLVGTLTVSLLVARLGTWPSARGPLVAGSAITAAGTAMIAWAASPVVAVGGAVVLGIGTAIFTSHAMPLLVHRTPRDRLARFQALLGLAQAAAILAATNGLGLLASHVGPTASIVAASGACALAGVVVLATPSLRAAALPYVGRAER
jgi:MFS family permease